MSGANVLVDSEEQLRFLEKNPDKYLEYRKQIENELNKRFKFIIKGSPGMQTDSLEIPFSGIFFPTNAALNREQVCS